MAKSNRILGGDGEDYGLAVYHREWDHRLFAGVHRKVFDNGMVRRTWVDHNGKAIMTGWFYESWNT